MSIGNTKHSLPSALVITAGLAMLVLVLDVLVVPSLIALLERILGHGFKLEMLLRIHFAYASWILFLAVLVCLYVRPMREPRRRIILFILGIEILILIAIWFVDRYTPFRSEESAVTFFTSLVLILASLAALANAYLCKFLPNPDRLARYFWVLAGLAFLIAGLDETFEGHERIGRILAPIVLYIGNIEGIFQDLITILFAIGAVVFIAVFWTYFRREMLGAGSVSGWTLLAGIAVYTLAVFNDSADAVVEYFFLYADPQHVMNFAEEALEFTAANLFLASFCVAFIERIGKDHKITIKGKNGARNSTLRFLSLTLLVSTLVVSAVLTVSLRPSSPDIIAPAGYEFSVFADATDELNDADQLVFLPGLGLLVGNKWSSNVLRFDSMGNAQILIDSRTGLVSPDGIAIGDRSIYVADDEGHQVLEYAKDGNLIGRLDKGWVSPKGVAIDSRGVLHVADQKLRLVVRIGPGNSKIIASALDGLIAPEQLTFDDRGNLYVTDKSAQAVFRISPDGGVEEFITGEQGLQCPEAITFHRSHLYLTDSCLVAVLRFALDGSGGPFIQFTRKYRDLAGISFDDRGALYVAVGSNYRPHNLILQIRGAE